MSLFSYFAGFHEEFIAKVPLIPTLPQILSYIEWYMNNNTDYFTCKNKEYVLWTQDDFLVNEWIIVISSVEIGELSIPSTVI